MSSPRFLGQHGMRKKATSRRSGSDWKRLSSMACGDVGLQYNALCGRLWVPGSRSRRSEGNITPPIVGSCRDASQRVTRQNRSLFFLCASRDETRAPRGTRARRLGALPARRSGPAPMEDGDTFLPASHPIRPPRDNCYMYPAEVDRGIYAPAQGIIMRRNDGHEISCVDCEEDPEELRALRAWKVHTLTGERKGTRSLSVTRNRRLTFRIDTAEREICDVNLEDYH
jgi:plasmid maintenance system killer protein